MIEVSDSKKTFLGLDPQGRQRWALDAALQAIQFRENGGPWQDIDPSVEAPDTEGFSVKFTQVPYLGRIGDDSHRRIYPDRTDLSYWIQLEKPFASMPAPTRLDRWFYWDFPDALMGVRFDNMSIKFGFRLKNAAAPTSITIPFSTQGITRTGRLLYHDGQLIGGLHKPSATDANGDVRDCEVTFGPGEVTVSLDTTGLVFPIDIDPTLDLQIGHSNDDSYETGAGGYDSTSTIVYVWSSPITTDGTYRCGGFRFSSVDIPKGATIDVAYMSVKFVGAPYDEIKVDIYGNDVDDADDFVVNVRIISVALRPRTTAYATWIATGLGVNWVNSPSLVSVVQEIVDRAGWAATNAMVFLYIAQVASAYNGRIVAYDSSAANAAKLHVEYTASGGGASESMGAKLIAAKLV